jgi:quinohemoprotein ethanol dehydrogenase
VRNANAKKCFVASLIFALVAVAAAAQNSHRVDDAALLNAASNGDEWLTYGHDYAETHYSPLKQIDSTNASRLGLAWYFDTASESGSEEAVPIVSNGTMYVTVTWGVLYALDARTGQLKWSWDPKIGHQNFPPKSAGDPNRVRTGPSLCCGPGNRGVAVYDGKVYIGTLDARLVALDAETGKIVWEIHTADPNSDYSITGAPRIVRGNVIIGNGGGEFGVRGYVTAYNAQTGKQVWRFYTVPGDPSKPFENEAMKMAAKTWSGDWYKLGGGANAWNAISYDPKLNLIYFGTGQGGPWVAKFRDPKGGDNLFICSILAVRADTGKYVWHFQTTPGDEWDYDSIADLILADIKINGKLRHVIMQAPKNGYFYVLDRTNGKFISGIPLQKVTWNKGLDPKTGRPIPNPDAKYGTAGNMVTPGAGGGHVWPTMSFNPNTGLVYVNPGMATGFRYVQAPEFKPVLGEYNWGIVFRSPAPPPGTPAARDGQTAPLPPPPPSTPEGGFLVARDPATATERWRVPQMSGGGTMTTAGNLVFASSNIGEFVALSADEGKILWKVKLQPGFANPITYALNGKQYVSVLNGRGGKSRVYTFALDANVPVPASPFAASQTAAPAPDQPHQPPQR